MNRAAALAAAGEAVTWDVLVVGGGATGLGAALDAVSRGYRTILLEAADFAKGTSSRSTKLSHGGVRYLQQGNIALVLEALKERGRMLRNAPHLVRRQAFLIPAYHAWELPFYGIGLFTYDLMSGGSTFGRSSALGAQAARQRLPTVVHDHLAGGIVYYDGQFDDARYAIALAQTVSDRGGTVLNDAKIVRLLKRDGKVCGAVARNGDTGTDFEISARVVINATGVFTEDLRRLDDPASESILSVSQGTHFVVPKSFLPGTDAVMIPKTEDGRVLFAIPWHGAVVVGTTDDPVPAAVAEPRALPDEIHFLRKHIALYFGREPQPAEVLSVWSGLRPLIRKAGVGSTAALSREHSVLVSPSGLVSVAGGKWTTYRRMGEDAVTIAARSAGLPARPSATAEMRLHGWSESAAFTDDPRSLYGSDQAALDRLSASSPQASSLLTPELPYTVAEVLWAAREEMAQTVEDVLARRTRALFLNARAAIAAAPAVAALLAAELGKDAAWQREQIAAFETVASGYLYQA